MWGKNGNKNIIFSMKELHVNVYQTPQLGTMYVYNHKLSTYTCKLTNNNVKEVELENYQHC